ncbi:MAG: 50S ribosomal protein L30 [Pseudomonadota bacterium]|jgi:large subunit ribosomal protein L30
MSKVRVKQVRSQIGRNPTTVRTLKAIGLGAIGKQKELTLNPSVQGMLDTVKHLVEVTPVK